MQGTQNKIPSRNNILEILTLKHYEREVCMKTNKARKGRKKKTRKETRTKRIKSSRQSLKISSNVLMFTYWNNDPPAMEAVGGRLQRPREGEPIAEENDFLEETEIKRWVIHVRLLLLRISAMNVKLGF